MTDLTKKRIESIDLLKGLVIVIMALDHVRDYFHYSAHFFDPNDPEKTNAALYLTRFITNFCAPSFSFLAGVSAFMVGKRKSPAELSVFLVKRGLWLVFVEVVIMNFGWMFDITYHTIVFQVIWCLGVSMIVLAGLIRLPRKYILIFSCVLIFGHNLLDQFHPDAVLWTFLHERRAMDFLPGHVVRSGYGLIPWVAVMSLGFVFGTFYDKTFDPARRKKIFNLIGAGALVIFLIIRISNVYGNILPWQSYDTIPKTLYSFFALSKYPPSLSFLLVTLGTALLLLANCENLKGRMVNFFCVFGRVPFFFYIIHVYFIHLLALIVAAFTPFGWRAMILSTPPVRAESLRGFGFNLVIVYGVWIFVIALLYPLCKQFDTYKQRHKEKWWLSYL